MIKKNKKKIYFIIELLIVTALFIGASNLSPLNIFAYSAGVEDPAVFEENYYYKVSDSELMRLSKDKVEGLWLPADPPAYESKGVPVDDPTAMVSSDGDYIPSEFQRSEGLGLSYTAPNEGLFLKYLKEDQSKTIFPPDDRVDNLDTAVYPWGTIVKLWIIAADGTGLMGSGTIIDDFHVLTVGHCVWSHKYGDNWVQSIEVVPGLDPDEDSPYMPFYHANVTKMKTYANWTQDADRDHDWAVLTLDRNVGTWTGWLGRSYKNDLSWYSDRLFNTAGYPGDLSYNGVRMYYTWDYSDYATEYIVYHYLDAMGGQSGSPIYYIDGTSGNRYTSAIMSAESSSYNLGTRINEEKFNRIYTWLDDDVSPTDYADLIDDGQYWSGFTSDNSNPDEIWTGDPFSVWNDVRNRGTEYSGDFTVSYYCSTNTTISTSDYLIGTYTLSSIRPFREKVSAWNGDFPSNIPTGNYYVGWIIDSNDDVPELRDSGEDNNITRCEDGTLTVYWIPDYSPPQVETMEASTSNLTSTSAQLNGNLIDMGGCDCEVWFEYGTTTSYGSSTTPFTKTWTGVYGQPISGLTPNTTYHFRAKASNTEGSDDGLDKSFRTLANVPGIAGFSPVTETSIQANWTANGNPAGTQYYCENTTKGTNSGWTTNLYWNSTGLSDNTTYHFQVKAKNAVGVETNWTDLGSQPTDIGDDPPQVTTNNASAINQTEAQLNGNLDSTGGLSCEVWFEYGKTTSYGTPTTKQSKSSTATGPFSQAISSLTPNTTYHFRAKASNTEGPDDGLDESFTTLANQPGTAAFSNVTETSIQANWTANVNPAGTQYYCENTTKGTNSGWVTDLNWNSTGLEACTTYHFRVKAKNGDGIETGWIELGEIRTPCPFGVTTNNASSITASSAQLNGNLDDTGGLTCEVWFEYGETTSYGTSTTKQPKSSTGSFNQTISALASNTTYHFRACASNTAGSFNGADHTFTTLANVPGTAGFSPVTETSIQANWTANGNPVPPGTQYYCENTTKGTNSGWITDLNWNSTGLVLCTTYHFRVKARNADGVETGWLELGDQKTSCTTDTNLKLNPANQTVLNGAKGTVDIVVEDVTNLMGADITLNFDDSKLKYDSSAPGSLWSPEGLLVFSPLATGGSVNIQLSAEVANAKTGSGTIITVTFERIASGVTNICFGTTELRDEAWQVITHTKGGCCSFSECIGDFNGDLQVNFGDLGIFAMAYRSTVGDDNWNPICDLDGDGSVGFNDLGIFAMHYRDDCRP